MGINNYVKLSVSKLHTSGRRINVILFVTCFRKNFMKKLKKPDVTTVVSLEGGRDPLERLNLSRSGSTGPR
jgi:hypothetical protein